jgi:hypothetical protein
VRVRQRRVPGDVYKAERRLDGSIRIHSCALQVRRATGLDRRATDRRH